jgi:NADPH:quinone reductase-like Zn-dependent oxidoreductase
MQSYWVQPTATGVALERRDVPRPEPQEGQLLVAVKATCFNRGEFLVGHGTHAPAAKIAGGDCAGEIAAVSAGVTGFSVGERVMGRCSGGFAEYATMDAREALRIPDRLSWEQAAAIPLSFMVVHDMLVTYGHLKSGEWLLVTAASSGVGVGALQVAKLLGAKVIGTSGSAEKLARLEKLGLDVGVTTRGAGFYEPAMQATGGKGVNLVVNNVGGTVFAECIRCLAYEGRLATVGYLDQTLTAEIDLAALHAKRLNLFGVSNKLRSPLQRAETARALEKDFMPWFADGSLSPVIDRMFTFADVPAARSYFDSNAVLGKVVLRT